MKNVTTQSISFAQFVNKNNAKSYALELSLLIALLISALLCADFAFFSNSCDNIKDDLLRVHIIPNSDSSQDQELKLAVRDDLLNFIQSLNLNFQNKDDAVSKIKQNLPSINLHIANTIKKLGFNYNVSAKIDNRYFNTRHYQQFTTPAGFYDAICVDIGEASGQNWWCVAFPSLCLPAASPNIDLADFFDKQEVDIITNKSYAPKLFILEMINNIFA